MVPLVLSAWVQSFEKHFDSNVGVSDFLPKECVCFWLECDSFKMDGKWEC